MLFNLPYASISSVRVTPTLDVLQGDGSVEVEATTGGFGRTRTILNLNYQSPTLSIVHALDERNTISPTISLYNAKIIYQWNVLFKNGSLRTKVDPTSAIEVTWTDQSANDGGLWVTDFRLPLESSIGRALAADIKVRRQFRF
jgi:hypothetical protein